MQYIHSTGYIPRVVHPWTGAHNYNKLASGSRWLGNEVWQDTIVYAILVTTS